MTSRFTPDYCQRISYLQEGVKSTSVCCPWIPHLVSPQSVSLMFPTQQLPLQRVLTLSFNCQLELSTFSSSSSSPFRISAYDFRRTGSLKRNSSSQHNDHISQSDTKAWEESVSWWKKILTPAWNFGFLWSSLAAIVVRASRYSCQNESYTCKASSTGTCAKKYLFCTWRLVLKHLITTESQKLSDCEPEKLPAWEFWNGVARTCRFFYFEYEKLLKYKIQNAKLHH